MKIRLEINEEELEALIDFQRNMRDLALEDNEKREAVERADRIEYLKTWR